MLNPRHIVRHTALQRHCKSVQLHGNRAEQIDREKSLYNIQRERSRIAASVLRFYRELEQRDDDPDNEQRPAEIGKQLYYLIYPRHTEQIVARGVHIAEKLA